MIVFVDASLARATAAVEVIAARALDTERLGRLPPETLALLLDMDIPRMVMPRRWQGLELGFPAVLDVIMALARGCMSTAWCAALFAEHPWILARFDARAQADVWQAGPNVPIAMSIASSGTARPVGGGFLLSGTWPFASGCDHADWFLLDAEYAAEEGSESRSGLCLVPRRDVSIDQASWHVAGLRGTGSKTLTVDGARVPRHRLRDAQALTAAAPDVERVTPADGSARSALFCQPFNGTLGLVLTAVAVGGAEGALEHFRERIVQRVLRRQGHVQALDPAAQMDLAESTLQIKSARLLLEDGCEMVRAAGECGVELTAFELAEMRVRKAYVVRQCTAAIDRLFAASGGGALQESSPLQRFWRDVHAIQAHGGMAWSATAQNYGSLAVGLQSTIRRPY